MVFITCAAQRQVGNAGGPVKRGNKARSLLRDNKRAVSHINYVLIKLFKPWNHSLRVVNENPPIFSALQSPVSIKQETQLERWKKKEEKHRQMRGGGGWWCKRREERSNTSTDKSIRVCVKEKCFLCSQQRPACCDRLGGFLHQSIIGANSACTNELPLPSADIPCRTEKITFIACRTNSGTQKCEDSALWPPFTAPFVGGPFGSAAGRRGSHVGGAEGFISTPSPSITIHIHMKSRAMPQTAVR